MFGPYMVCVRQTISYQEACLFEQKKLTWEYYSKNSIKHSGDLDLHGVGQTSTLTTSCCFKCFGVNYARITWWSPWLIGTKCEKTSFNGASISIALEQDIPPNLAFQTATVSDCSLVRYSKS